MDNMRDQLRNVQERRVLSTDAGAFEMREVPNGTGGTKIKFEGYASVVERGYGVWAPSVGDFTEIIGRSAFDKTLSENPDVSLKLNHEGFPLARTTAGDLTLRADDTGLLAHADLNPERADVILTRQMVDAGHLGAMSFAFRVTRQEWSEDGETRHISEVNLNHGDVSIVEHPANGATTGMMALRNAAQRTGHDEMTLTRMVTEGTVTIEEIAAYVEELRALDEALKIVPPAPGEPNPAEKRTPSKLAIAQLRMVAAQR